MYQRSAEFYDAIYSWKDYAAEVAKLRTLLTERGITSGRLLDVACGTGKHLELLRADFDVEGLELEPSMVEIARERLLDVLVTKGDMRDFNLGRRFEVVTCLFSAIGHMLDLPDLHRALSAMASHLAPGGLLIVEPWFFPHQFTEGYLGGDFHNGEQLKVARIARSWTEGPISVLEMHYLVGAPDRVEHFTELFHLGLFTDGEYQKAFRDAELEVEHDANGLMGRGLYIGRKAEGPGPKGSSSGR